MKSNLYTIAAVIGISTLFGTALLAASGNSTAEIPFDFQIQDHTMHAGSYTVSPANGHGMYNVTNRETGESVFVSAPVNDVAKAGESKLAFRKYGERYFLAQIWFGGEAVGHGTVPGNSEKELIGIPAKNAPVLATIRLK